MSPKKHHGSGTKRKRAPAPELSLHLSGGGAGDDLEACLLEMDTLTTTTAAASAALPLSNAASQMDSNMRTKERDTDESNNKAQLICIGQPHPRLQPLERLREWRGSFDSWQKSGRYTPGLLPSFDLEVARHFKVQELSSYLIKHCPPLRMPAVERWLLDTKVEEQVQAAQTQSTTDDGNPKKKKQRRGKRHEAGAALPGSDPILPSDPWDLPATRRLQQEMEHACTTSNDPLYDNLDLKKIVKELCRRTRAAVLELLHKQRQSLEHVPLQKGDRIVLEDDPTKKDDSRSTKVVRLVYHRKRWKQPFRIRLNHDHYEKLQRDFCQAHGFSSLQPTKSKRDILHVFHLLVMTLSLRYSSLSGGQLLNDLRGGGMQGAIHEEVFQALSVLDPPKKDANKKHSVLLLEAYASPLNHACANYASAYASDLDFHFGAVGSFVEMIHNSMSGLNNNNESHIICEVNPPFSPSVMETQMVPSLEYWLTDAESKQQSLSLVVIVPTANEKKYQASLPPAKKFAQASFQTIVSSSYTSLHVVLESQTHGYVEGAQHLRPTRYKESQYDTSVILLQTTKARQWYARDQTAWKEKIQKAFASKHKEELEKRRVAD